MAGRRGRVPLDVKTHREGFLRLQGWTCVSALAFLTGALLVLYEVGREGPRGGRAGPAVVARRPWGAAVAGGRPRAQGVQRRCAAEGAPNGR
jgi:hypothetical protein